MPPSSSRPASQWRAPCWRWPSCPAGPPRPRRGASRPARSARLPPSGDQPREARFAGTQGAGPRPGLRERKKARTRAEIQRHALRLFRRQGYEATTISQIAEAAEVSESTFFRYFPTKEDVVLWDEFDPVIVDAFRSQPVALGPIPALRAAFRL